ncbi:hypothetical protein [Saccharothrix coeruleofusca]|uniref:Uncharacterized protein n=1 Tax=Saccharothrix coeruleofusca TaxID=33919 RepID=A0A918AIC3_9PSEU|nr:hypothetical protein [Saccharothrix coeruleofusca]GGP41972.1 hypothetical protein GCM10010185_11560 [Saccharothrix coeruleofusca]
MSEAAPAENKDAEKVEPEHRLIPTTANTAHGGVSGAQVGTVTGNITIHNGVASQPDLRVLRATDDEINEVRHHFEPPGHFRDAGRALIDKRVVVLAGPGTGRTYTARRLLVDLGATAVVDANRDRPLGSFQADELRSGEGYVWDATELGERPFTDREFTQCLGVVRSVGCHLVIVVDRRTQAPSAAADHVVTLLAPNALAVAQETIRKLSPDAVEGPTMVLKSDLAPVLADRDPPEKAVRAAALAVRVCLGELTASEALAQLEEDVEDAVAHWLREWSTLEYSFSFAVALLENQPYDEVVTHALALDKKIREAELPEDKKLRPRRVFDSSKEQLLRDVGATTVVRKHPKHDGLREETVRFERQGWAAVVLRRLWREYPMAQEILCEWMCAPAMLGRFREATRRALCAFITEVPAHDPLRVLDNLAARGGVTYKPLIASTLQHLADDHRLAPLVEQALESWTKNKGSPYRQWTAAWVYGSPFGRRDVHHALARLGRIAESTNYAAQNGVVYAVLSMLEDRHLHTAVLDQVVSWTSGRGRRNGLRPVSLALGLWIAGFPAHRPRWLEDLHLEATHPRQVRALANMVMGDDQFGDVAINRLSALAVESRWKPTSAARLVRLAALICDDLSWWGRRATVRRLARCHPTRRTELHRAFRAARRAQRRD